MEKRPIHKLTQEPVSEEFLNVLKRLRTGEEVPMAEINALPEIKFANACVSNTPTIGLSGREVIQENVYNRLQKMGSAVTQSDGTVSLSGEVRCDKRLDIVIGLPAAGKSSAVAEPISEMFKSRIIDSDEAKKMLPGFDNGWGAGAVHKESQLISGWQLKTALKKGENITYPRVGGNAMEMMDIINLAKKSGYKVYVHYNELDRNKALGRMLERFLTTGRYLKPELITQNGDNISETYRQLKKSGLIDGFTKWNNDVPFGERPISVEHSASCNDVYAALREKPKETKVEAHKEDVIAELSEKIDQLQADLLKSKIELARLRNTPQGELARAADKFKSERDILRGKIDELNEIFRELPEAAKAVRQKRTELREKKANERGQNRGQPNPPRPPKRGR